MEVMKRIKKQDWTRVLQERLQDAELTSPSFADLIGESPESVQNSPVFSGQPLAKTGGLPGKGGFFGTASPWLWALAGVAAALVAGLLIFRPTPVIPDSPVAELVDAPILPDSVAEPVEAPSFAGSSGESPATVQGAGHAGQVSSTKTAQNEDKALENVASSTKQGQNDEETPDHPSTGSGFARNDETTGAKNETVPGLVAEPVEAVEGPSFAGWIDEPTATRHRPRLALRVHAATAGTFARSGDISFRTFSWVEKEYIGGSLGATDGYGAIASSLDTGNETNQSSQLVLVTYKEQVYRVVPVERAPTLPVSFGVSGELDLSRHWALTLGLDYTQRAGYWLSKDIPQSLSLHYLGFPLEAHYLFWPEGRFRLYLGGGLKVEKCILAKGGEPLKDPFLFSWNLQGGADYRLAPGIRLYAAPVFTQYFNHSAYANTWDDKFQLQLHVGLSFDLK